MDLMTRFYSREDFHQSTAFAAVMESIGWSSIPVNQARVAVKQLGPVSLAKMQRATVIDFRELKKLRNRLHILRFILEPACAGDCIDLSGKKHKFSFLEVKSSENTIRLFSHLGFSQTKEHYAHTKTAILDLSVGMASLMSHFPSKTRYNIKIANRLLNTYKSIRFDQLTTEQKEDFFKLHTHWSSEKKIYGFSNDFLEKVITCFGPKGWMIQAVTNGKYSGGMMILIHDRIAYYFYTCTSAEGKVAHVPTGLAAAAFGQAINQGADIFDFCSVFDERFPNEHPRWRGFTQFKSRFLPVSVYYPPSFSRWF